MFSNRISDAPNGDDGLEPVKPDISPPFSERPVMLMNRISLPDSPSNHKAARNPRLLKHGHGTDEHSAVKLAKRKQNLIMPTLFPSSRGEFVSPTHSPLPHQRGACSGKQEIGMET